MVTLSRLYPDDARALKAILALRDAGLGLEVIGVLSARRGAQDVQAGALAGDAAGFLAARGLLVLPGIGPVVAAGWLAESITSALMEGAAGNVAKALGLVGLGGQVVHAFLDGVSRGFALVSIKVPAGERSRYETVLAQAA